MGVQPFAHVVTRFAWRYISHAPRASQLARRTCCRRFAYYQLCLVQCVFFSAAAESQPATAALPELLVGQAVGLARWKELQEVSGRAFFSD